VSVASTHPPLPARRSPKPTTPTHLDKEADVVLDEDGNAHSQTEPKEELIGQEEPQREIGKVVWIEAHRELHRALQGGQCPVQETCPFLRPTSSADTRSSLTK
jgi:hypothetical protein